MTFRFFGRSPSGWNPLRFCLNYSCCNAPEKQIRLLPTICSLWECTERSIFRIGSIGISPKLRSSDPSSRFPSLQALFRPCSTRTFSTSITTSKTFYLGRNGFLVTDSNQGPERKKILSSGLRTKSKGPRGNMRICLLCGWNLSLDPSERSSEDCLNAETLFIMMNPI